MTKLEDINGNMIQCIMYKPNFFHKTTQHTIDSLTEKDIRNLSLEIVNIIFVTLNLISDHCGRDIPWAYTLHY